MDNFEHSIENGFRDLVALIGKDAARRVLRQRAHKSTVSNWEAGRRPVPQWAIAALDALWAEQQAAVQRARERIKKRPEIDPRPLNLAKWKAENPR